jgi:moderate conductance mechanosensitive channel
MTALDLSSNNLLDPIISGVNQILPKLPAALVALVLGYLIIRILSWLSRIILSLWRMPRGLRNIIHSIIDTLLWVFLSISILQVLGLNNIAFVLSGSVAAIGLALAVGSSTLVSDILSGIFLARDRDFSLGDHVRAGDPAVEGTVEAMDMRRTRIRDADGNLHIMPNSVVERKEWILYAKRKDRA